MSREANKEAQIRQLYTELNKHGQAGEFEKAIKSANKSKHSKNGKSCTDLNHYFSVLSMAPEEEKAALCKVVSLLQLSRFDEALKFINKSEINNMIFERSYCEYRLNLPEKALKTIEAANLNPLPDNLKELKAQILYRLERYEDCYDLYKDIIKNTNDDYDDERTTNLSAVLANLSIEGSVSNLYNTN